MSRKHGKWGLLLVLAALGAVGCGHKPPEDASSVSSDPNVKPDDGTGNVKWEGASDDDKQARKAGPPAGTQPAAVGGSGQSRRMDEYDKEQTEVVLKRAARQVKDNCGHASDENGKQSGPWGKVTLQVALGHNGHSKGATIPAPFEGKPTGRCAVQAFSNLTFPPWAGADATIDWEIEIPQPGK